MNRLFAFSEEFYSVEFDDYEYGVLGAEDLEDAQRQLPSSHLEIVEIGKTDLYGFIMLGRRSKLPQPKTVENDLPSFYSVLIEVLTYVGRTAEYHDWAIQARRKWFSSTEVEGWERVVEKVDRYEQVWWLNPLFREELPVWVKKEASLLTINFDGHGNPYNVKY